MNKTFIVIHREFSSRVRKKSFLLVTLLVPLLPLAFYALLFWMLLTGDSRERVFLVVNESAIEAPLGNLRDARSVYVDSLPEAGRTAILARKDYYAIVRVPENVMNAPEIFVYTLSQLPVELKDELAAGLRVKIERMKRDEVIARAGLPDIERQLEATRTPVNVRSFVVSGGSAAADGVLEAGDREGSSEVSFVMGMLGAMIIFMFIIIFASRVMRGVIEEKTSRVIEVIVSSVRPFQFLLGKIIGIAAVGLLQFFIWIAFGLLLFFFATSLLPALDLAGLSPDLRQGTGAAVLDVFAKLDPSFIFSFIALFIFYFLGGYFLYGSIFAAVGSACDSETDSQQFVLPFTFLLMIAFYIGIAAAKNPETSLAFWSSIIPLTSPIVMIARLPFGVSAWEVALSMALLVVAFLFFAWLSGKIYRVGILMHGKKTTWRELYKWIKYKG